MYDVVIIGAGPAGLTSAIYAARANMKTLMLDGGIYGGLMQKTLDIENYPGYTYITGPDLSEKMYEQALSVGAEYKWGQVQSIDRLTDGTFYVHTGKDPIHTKSIILATGATPKKLGVPGEEELAGRGVSYCAVCDGAFFKGKHLLVIGGGDSAIEEANYLTKFAESVRVLYRGEKLRAQPVLVDRALANPKIKIQYHTELKEIQGDGKVQRAVLTEHGGLIATPCDGVFIYVGNKPNTGAFKNITGLLNEAGYIPTDELMRTNVRGIFAAGDVREKTLRQIATAVGDGTQAAISAQHYVEALEVD